MWEDRCGLTLSSELALCPSVHSGFESKYEKDLFITVRSGVVIGERLVVNGDAAEVNGTGSGGFDDYVIPDFVKKQAD